MNAVSPSLVYVGDLEEGATALHRLETLRSFGLTVAGLDHNAFHRSRVPKLGALKWRYPFWPATRGYCATVLDLVNRHNPAVVWFDKPILLRPSVLRELRRQGRFTVHYTVDDATGRSGEAHFRNINACIPEFDLSLVSRRVSIDDYRALGARDVEYFQLAYDDALHRPPPQNWTDADRPVDVMFIGTPHDDRPEFLEGLWREHGIVCRVHGGKRWRQRLGPQAADALMIGPPVLGQDYVDAIWSAKICLSFITRANRDDVAHRSFELAACGACMVAAWSPAHEKVFEAGREIVFFTSVKECADHIRALLADPNRRLAIGRAARERAVRDGYGNRETMARVLRHIANTRPDLDFLIDRVS